ncbi:OmpA family protein [Tranquillimonas alkanivorans]|uniref:OmpA family protein n=1 Tax=Tranquillimonas alkanivorans TaxID=441119 RepID=A0A1I5PH22_9RHOB|nr:OmpA family protein [Tranquillimonas alkanivorans]SFP33422.1 OmpA family protein [Tranquillimonas alkanivorans]
MLLRSALSFLLCALPAWAGAELSLPAAARLTAEESRGLDRHEMAVGAWTPEGIATLTAEGSVTRRAWRLQGQNLTTLQLLAPLRRQLYDAGYEILFECESDGCGGFDFRFSTDLLGAPAMHVDLGDFRYLAARRDDSGTRDLVSLMVSRAPGAGYVQVTQVGPPEDRAPALVTSTMSVDPDGASAEDDLAAQLAAIGRAPLEGLSFGTGSATLAAEGADALADLAEWLRENPDRTATLVGHTDAEGPLAPNVALSRQRAAAVRDRLVDTFGIPADRLRAEGVGYLAPRASNASADGRLANRRVEVVVTGE